jgi:chromosome segregation ATPase
MAVYRFVAATVLAAALLGGCASQGPRPTEDLTRAKTLIEQADRAGAQRYAAAELDQARDRLKQAEDAADQGKQEIAQWRASEAAANAELAMARADNGEAHRAADELQKSIDTLRQEAERPAAAPKP